MYFAFVLFIATAVVTADSKFVMKDENDQPRDGFRLGCRRPELRLEDPNVFIDFPPHSEIPPTEDMSYVGESVDRSGMGRSSLVSQEQKIFGRVLRCNFWFCSSGPYLNPICIWIYCPGGRWIQNGNI